jgi:ADP-dependent NAD(P)H-hydrate dehydratase / NAD(P)H-hydrate epimerase
MSLIKILSTQQIRSLDVATIQNEPVLSIDLMERASRAFTNWFIEHFSATHKIGVICGLGNNGGDGLAIARMLLEWGYPVKVWIVRGSGNETEDFAINLARLKNKSHDLFEITSQADQGLFHDRDVLIDALFGSGLSRAAEDLHAQAIRCINQTNAVRVSVDIPSGLFADKHSDGEIVKAHHTVTFHLPKLSFFFPEAHQYTGQWTVVDIELDKSFIRSASTSYFYVTQKAARRIIKPRLKFDHKGDFGHVLLIAGSYGKMGAAILSSRATLRAGAGLLTVHVPSCGYEIIQNSVPEAMAEIDPDDKCFTNILELINYSAVGIGPGLGKDVQTVDAFNSLLNAYRKPMVIDADALNILSEQSHLLKLVPEGSILTPHPKEFQRLVGKWSNDFDRLEKQKTLASALKSVVVLKGAYTSIASPDGDVYFNSSGNPGMATGGTGDVLTGIITSLLAQRYSAIDAAVLGVFVHGLSGDMAAAEKGMISMTASDVIEYLPEAFRKLCR